MAITLVPKYARAVADQINAYYRLLTGADPQSVDIRLNGGGHFNVRHSGTNAALFTVTDDGATGSITPAPGSVTNTALAADAVTRDKIKDGEILDPEINAAAAIAVSKLAHVGAGNVLKSNGTQNAGGQVANADVAAGAGIAYSKLSLGSSIVNADVAAAGTANIALNKLAPVAANQIVKDVGAGVVGGGLLVDANVAAAGTANIALGKLAPGSSGVLKSDGTTITAGNLIVTANMGTNTIDGSVLADSTVPGAKILGGAPPPNGAGAADAYKAYATAAAGTTVTLQKLDTGHLLANAVTRAVTSGNWSQSGLTATTFTQIHASSAVTLSGATGAPVLVFIVGSLSNTVAGGVVTVGLSLDGAAPATATTGQGAAGYNVPYTVMWLFPSPTAGTRVFSAVYQVQAATSGTIAGNIIVVELKR